MLFLRREMQFRNKIRVGKFAIFAPGIVVPRSNNVLAIVRRPDGKYAHLACNLVTNDGDLYYAQKAMDESPTDEFDDSASPLTSGLRLGSGGLSPAAAKGDTDLNTFIASTGKAVTKSTVYPKTNDADGDNTGAGTDIATWLYEYTKGDFNSAIIDEGAIVDDLTTPTAALTHFEFASVFEKTANDTLKVFVNHTFNGT